MFDLSKCDSCGDYLLRCQYVDYSREKAVQEIPALIEGKDAEILSKYTACMACNEYCQKGANPYDLILQHQEEKRILPVLEERLPMFAANEKIPSQVINGDPDKSALSICTFNNRLPEEAVEDRMFDVLTMVEEGLVPMPFAEGRYTNRLKQITDMPKSSVVW